MTILAFASVILAFLFSIISTAMFFGGLEIHDNTPSKAPMQAHIAFEESNPVYTSPNPIKTQRIDFGAYRTHRLNQARINALAVLSEASEAADCIKWAVARDANTNRYSVNPLAMSDRARWGYDKVFSGEDALARIQDILSDMDTAALANW